MYLAVYICIVIVISQCTKLLTLLGACDVFYIHCIMYVHMSLCYYSDNLCQEHMETWRYLPTQIFYPGYKFSTTMELVDRHLIIPIICSILTIVNCYYKCSAIIGLHLHDDFYLVASDFVILFCLPKGQLMTCYNSCTAIVCLVQLIRTVVFCNNDLHMEYYAICYLLLLLLYGCKLYLLMLLLKRFSVTLESIVLLAGEDTVSVLPMTITYYTQKSLLWVDYMSGSLLILMLIIEELEKNFLKRREEALADDNSDTYYDDNMDITALYITTKQQLQECRADHENLSKKFGQYRKNAEKETEELQKQVNTLEKDLSTLKETNKDIKELRCCICHDNQSNILLQPCNHLSICEECLKRIRKDRKYTCPICRKNIKNTIKVFS